MNNPLVRQLTEQTRAILDRNVLCCNNFSMAMKQLAKAYALHLKTLGFEGEGIKKNLKEDFKKNLKEAVKFGSIAK